MCKAFAGLRNRIGIMVPFQSSIQTFSQLASEVMKRKLGIECDDEIFVGTPDMFRGVEKDILIVVQLRNSTISGLG